MERRNFLGIEPVQVRRRVMVWLIHVCGGAAQRAELGCGPHPSEQIIAPVRTAKGDKTLARIRQEASGAKVSARSLDLPALDSVTNHLGHFTLTLGLLPLPTPVGISGEAHQRVGADLEPVRERRVRGRVDVRGSRLRWSWRGHAARDAGSFPRRTSG